MHVNENLQIKYKSNVSFFQVDTTLNRQAYSRLTSATCSHASGWDVKWFVGMCTAMQINTWKSAGILAKLIKDVEQMEKNQEVAEFGKIKMKHLGIISASHFSFAIHSISVHVLISEIFHLVHSLCSLWAAGSDLTHANLKQTSTLLTFKTHN